jgi:hypothetical protein
MKTRTFIIVAVAVFAALLGGFVYVALDGGGEERRAGALSTRSYVSGSWSLELDGQNVGVLKSLEGCHLEANVAAEAGGGKLAGAPRFTPCRLRFGLGMGKPLYTWISDVLGGKTVGARAVTLVQTDGTGKVATALNLQGAQITSFSVPALDAAAKEPGYFELKIEADTVEKGSSGGAAATTSAKAKLLMPAYFSVKIGGLDTTKIAKVSSWSFQRSRATGDTKLGQPELGNFELETSESSSSTFQAALEDLAVKGNATEWPGSIELLDATLKSVLFKVDFTGVGMYAGDLYGAAEAADALPRRAYSFYVESAKLDFAGAS